MSDIEAPEKKMLHGKEEIRPDAPPCSRSRVKGVPGPGLTSLETPWPHAWTLRGRLRRPWAVLGHLSVGVIGWDEAAGARGRSGPPRGTLVTLPVIHTGQVTPSLPAGAPRDTRPAAWTRG